MINIKNIDPNKIKINYSLHWVSDDQRLEICKDQQCKSFIPCINKINEYFEEANRNKYLTLVPTDESTEIMKTYEEIRSKIKDLIRVITNNSNDYDETM